jgi:alpha-galactosidase
MDTQSQVIAAQYQGRLIDGLPAPPAWTEAAGVTFCTDWQGCNATPELETEARLLWSDESIFIRFLCRYQDVHVFPGAIGRRDGLWERDVAEIFLWPGAGNANHYREFEIAPNGDWLDLDINAGQRSILYCDLKTKVTIDAANRVWIAQIGIPMTCLSADFDPDQIWRVNLFRIEQRELARFYSAWRPTRTAKPNFHVPEHFGSLCFRHS